MSSTTDNANTKDKKIEIGLLIIGGFFLFVLGSTRLMGAYNLYNSEGSLGNFIWLQYCALLYASGAIGVLMGLIFGSMQLLSRNK